MPGELGEDARLDPVRRVGAGVKVLRENLAAFGMGDEIGEQCVEMRSRHGAVIVPPDRALGRLVANDEFILRAAAGMNAGFGDQRAAGGDFRLAAAQGFAIKMGRSQIPMDGGKVLEAEPIGAVTRVENPALSHFRLPRLGVAALNMKRRSTNAPQYFSL